MKIRTDFVTNSSSSSFVAILDLQLENGTSVKASYEDNLGEGKTIHYASTDYYIENESDIMMLEELKDATVCIDGRNERIKAGTWTLLCHASGEECFRSQPIYMLSNYFGCNMLWENIAELFDLSKPNQEIKQEMLEYAFFRKYTDESLDSIIKMLRGDYDEGNDTVIKQTLLKDGSMELMVLKGRRSLSEATDEGQAGKRRNPTPLCFAPDEVPEDENIDESEYANESSTDFEEYSSLQEQENEIYEAVVLKRLMRKVDCTVDEYLAKNYALTEAQQSFVLGLLRLDEDVVISGRSFELKWGMDYTTRQIVTNLIVERGGTVKSNAPGCEGIDVDYLVFEPTKNILGFDYPFVLDGETGNKIGNTRVILDRQMINAINRCPRIIKGEALYQDLDDSTYGILDSELIGINNREEIAREYLNTLTGFYRECSDINATYEKMSQCAHQVIEAYENAKSERNLDKARQLWSLAHFYKQPHNNSRYTAKQKDRLLNRIEANVTVELEGKKFQLGTLLATGIDQVLRSEIKEQNGKTVSASAKKQFNYLVLDPYMGVSIDEYEEGSFKVISTCQLWKALTE